MPCCAFCRLRIFLFLFYYVANFKPSCDVIVKHGRYVWALKLLLESSDNAVVPSLMKIWSAVLELTRGEEHIPTPAQSMHVRT
jgi:hypothetical protein